MKKTILIIVGILVLAGCLFALYLYWAIKLPVSDNTDNVVVEIVENDSTIEIAYTLKQQHLIKSPLVFRYYSLLSDKNIMPGIYYFHQNMNMDEILDILGEGRISEKRVTIPEGWRREQIAELLASAGIVDKDDFISHTKDLEGYLFPDTYQFGMDNVLLEVINKFINNFNTQTADLNLSDDDVILASIVEREARHDTDRHKIAGVYTNRLNIGMKLDADPTVQYVNGNWDPPKVSDLRIDSLYNTYIYRGLPPSAICNPGLKSIHAVLSPQQHDYYFFFNLRDGTTIYSKTYQEHKANIEKYRSKM
jgi:UPF0755 protein